MLIRKTFRTWLTRKSYILVVTLSTLLIAHLRTPKNFPFSGQYAFPLQDFLIHFFGTLVLWEIQFWNFKHLYQRRLYEQGFKVNLVGKLLALNLGCTFLFYSVYAPIIIIWIYRQPLTLYGFVVGLLLSLVFALLINICYLGWQLYRYWEVQKRELNAEIDR